MADNTAPLEDGTNSSAPCFDAIRHKQFSLRLLFLVVSGACLTASTAAVVGWPAVFIPLTVSAVTFASCGGKRADRRRRATCGALLGACLFIHAVGCTFAHETIGEVRSGLLHASLILHLPSLVIYYLGFPGRAVAVSLTLVLVLATPQFVWARRHAIARSEVERIVAFAEAAKLRIGHYPHDLTGYAWKFHRIRDFIEYDVTEQDHLMVYFWTGNRNAPHWYSCTSGWGYYPD